MMHYGQIEAVGAARQHVLTAAYAAHPERFVRRPPVPPTVPTAAWINPPPPGTEPTPGRPVVTPVTPLETAGVRQ
jgi:putative transposase